MTQTETVEQILARMKENARKIEFKGDTYYIVEGDLVMSPKEMHAHAVRVADLDAKGQQIPGVQKEPLLGMKDEDGRIIRWRKGLTLTYKVMCATFPNQEKYEQVALNMRQAAAAWEAICGVNFKHLKELDNGAKETTEKCLFQVVYEDFFGEFIAAAFFPNHPVERRFVYIDPSYFREKLSFDRVGVLRHELGHVLGFRHEHIRGGAPANCKKEKLDGVVELTPYDSKSVMHYLCGGVGDPDLVITELDRLGAREVYGPADRDVRYFE